MNPILRILTIALTLLFSGCSVKEADIHATDREPKAYESASVLTMGDGALLDHLQSLADEMSQATQNQQFAEMHHLEIALTKALNALEAKSTANLKPTIGTLKIIAAKIHGVGHDQNESMANTLNNTLQDQVAQLKRAYE